jgi:hypothetical protein
MKEDKSIALEKVLNVFLKKKFPHIKEFYVNCDEDIKRLSRMIFTDKGERVNRIFFYE